MSKNIVPARGMRDFLPADKHRRDEVINKVKSVYRAFGYEEIETPALENIERLRASEGGENLSMIFEVLKRGLPSTGLIDREKAVDLGLRYDLTLPLARFYASNLGKLPNVFRSMQIAPVWRAERPQKGRFRQFTQCDIDIIGIADERAEIELITITLLALEKLGLCNATVRLNDRRILINILEAFGFAKATYSTVLIVIDKLDKIGVDGVKSELLNKVSDAGEAINNLVRFLEEIYSKHEQGGNSFDTIPQILPSSVNENYVNKLKYISNNVTMAFPPAKIRLDPTLVRGLGYYTGSIFEIEIEGSGSSIAGGGRYDGMIGRFCKKEVPACGFSLGFERIIGLLDIGTQIRTEKLAMFYENGMEYGDILRKQRKLIELGYEVTTFPRPKKFGKSLQRVANDGFGSFIEVTSQDQVINKSDIRSTINEHNK